MSDDNDGDALKAETTCMCEHPQSDHVVTATGDNECWRCRCNAFAAPGPKAAA